MLTQKDEDEDDDNRRDDEDEDEDGNPSVNLHLPFRGFGYLQLGSSLTRRGTSNCIQRGQLSRILNALHFTFGHPQSTRTENHRSAPACAPASTACPHNGWWLTRRGERVREEIQTFEGLQTSKPFIT